MLNSKSNKKIIGIIDSGIDPEFVKKNSINIKSAFFMNINKEKNIMELIEFEKDDFYNWSPDKLHGYEDESGHGTAVLSILWQNYPDAEYIIAKVLDQNDQGYSIYLLEAFRWMIENYDLNAINISIGTNDVSIFYEFYHLTFLAVKKGIKVYAASKKNSMPGCFSTVIGVSNDKVFLEDDEQKDNQDDLENKIRIFYKGEWIFDKKYPSWLCPSKLEI